MVVVFVSYYYRPVCTVSYTLLRSGSWSDQMRVSRFVFLCWAPVIARDRDCICRPATQVHLAMTTMRFYYRVLSCNQGGESKQ
ncbi:hypothetical protein GOP47_0021688 [Adiantum capillus-veneris]|uniref:Uncharacterized protein n=1 Tax=Adiantum capillus-veneris TaxID=13818 RepID=A0A9D4U7X0_ADICA|nr:hypothetical protein GOP47_0021688 [Adiantum capillus-veneris]